MHIRTYNTCVRGYGTERKPGDPRILPDEDRAIANTIRTMCREVRGLMLCSAANTFTYFITISFNLMESAKGYDIVEEFMTWYRRHCDHCGIEKKYYLVSLPTPGNPEIIHMHMLLGEVPAGEFVPLKGSGLLSLTADAEAKIALGATPYGWPAFEKRFKSIAYIEKFGDMDERKKVITQTGKAQYMSRQFFIRKPESEGGGWDYAASAAFYRSWVDKGTRAFHHSRGLLKKAEPLTKGHIPPKAIHTILSCFSKSLKGYGGAYILSEKDGKLFLEMLTESIGWRASPCRASPSPVAITTPPIAAAPCRKGPVSGSAEEEAHAPPHHA